MLGPHPAPPRGTSPEPPPHPGVTSGAPEAEGQARVGKRGPAGGWCRCFSLAEVAGPQAVPMP